MNSNHWPPRSRLDTLPGHSARAPPPSLVLPHLSPFPSRKRAQKTPKAHQPAPDRQEPPRKNTTSRKAAGARLSSSSPKNPKRSNHPLASATFRVGALQEVPCSSAGYPRRTQKSS